MNFLVGAVVGGAIVIAVVVYLIRKLSNWNPTGF